MKIAFVSPPAESGTVMVNDLLHGCWCQGRRVAELRLPPLPQLLLASIAREEGRAVRVFDAPVEKIPAAELLVSLADFDMAVFHISSASHADDRRFIALLKERHPSVKVVVYGAHPTFMPDLFAEGQLYDEVIRFEPESDFRRLVGGGMSAPYGSMDELPFIDFGLLSRRARYFNPIGKYFRFATLMTSRGCPGKCTFCTVPEFYGRKWRAMSAVRVFREVSSLRKGGYREIFFRDENFTTSRERVMELCGMLRESGNGVNFIISSRVDHVDPSMLGALRSAGCRYVRYGVESGSQRILDGVDKGLERDKATEVFRKTREAGMKTHAHFIVGLPQEQPEDLSETLDFIRRLQPDSLTVGLFTPLPGSKLYRELAVREPLPDIEPSRLHLKAYGLSTDSPEACAMMDRLPSRIYRGYYLRISYIMRTLLSLESLQEFCIKSIGAIHVIRFAITG